MLSQQSRAVNITFVEIRMSVHLLIFFVCESNGLNILFFVLLSYFLSQFVICYTSLCCNTHSLLSIVPVLGSMY